MSNVRGGVRRGSRYLDNLDVTLVVDAERAFGWGGATLFAYGLYIATGSRVPSIFVENLRYAGESGQGRFADVMFYAFRVRLGGHVVDSERPQELLHDMMASPRRLGHRLAVGCQENRPIRTALHQSDALKPLHHLGCGRTRHAHMFGQVGEPGLSRSRDQIADELDIIFGHFRPMRLTHAPKGSRPACSTCRLRHGSAKMLDHE